MSNEKQSIYWNEVAGPKWVKISDAMDARFAGITALLLAHAVPRAGEPVLDIGCGTGSTARPFAAAGAKVTGIDISAPMLEVARARAGGIDYLLADAQVHDFGGKQFDLLASRFGVMFFADPVAAFTNLRATLAPGGRLCFVCWAPLAANPHWTIPHDLIVARLGAGAPKDPRAPGPMAFSDAAYVETVLNAAGFSEITVTPAPVEIIGQSRAEEARIACILGPSGALLDEKQADEATRDAARAEIATAFEQFATPRGIKLPATVNVVTARLTR